MTPQDTRAPHRQQRWIECYNASQQTLTHGDVVQVVDSSRPEQGSAQTPGGGRTVWHVDVARCDSPENTVVVGHKDIPAGEYGYCTADFPTLAKYSGQPQNGYVWGVAQGSTSLSANQTGFVIDGDPNGTLVQVRKTPYPVRIYQARAIDCAEPGFTDTDFTLRVWDETNQEWTDSATTIQVDDPVGVFVVFGDVIWVYRVSDPVCGDKWYTAHPYGLHRKVKPIGNIDCDSSGLCTVWLDTGTGCSTTASNCTILVCNDWGFTSPKFAGREYKAQFYNGAWHFIQEPYPTRGKALLSGDMCPDDANGSVQGFTTTDYCSDIDVTTGVNELGLSGEQGDVVYLEYHVGSDDWRIYQVEHKCRDIIAASCADAQSEPELIYYAGCEIRAYIQQKTSMMSCKTPESKKQIQLYTWQIATEFDDSGSGQSKNCQLLAKAACLFDDPAEQAGSALIDFTPEVVLQDVRQNELCLEGYIKSVYVPCSDGGEWVDLVCGTDCSSGSGSQQQ